MEYPNCSASLFDNLSKNNTFEYKVALVETRIEDVLSIGAAICILTALIIDLTVAVELSKHGILSASFTKLYKIFYAFNVIALGICICIVLVLVLSIAFLVLVIAGIYKLLCSEIIKRKDNHFVEFLEGFDVFWSLEDDASKSVINVLGVIEADSPVILAENIKEQLRNIYSNNDTRKIFYRRKEEYGFYYWSRYSHADMDQYVEVVDLTYSDYNLQTWMSNLQNQPLPYEDEGLFKILITKQRVGNHNDGVRSEYGIAFRIHHSIGDGVVLIEFLCQSLADKDKTCPVNMFSMPESKKQDSSRGLLEMMRKLCEFPMCFMYGVVRKPDKSSLHGPALSGKKLFTWTETDENLLLKVKEIKDNVKELTFSAVLLAALSRGLNNLFNEIKSPIPEDIAVVLPIRFPKTSAEKELKLINDFSVTILDLPTKSKSCIEDLKHRCSKLRKSADPLTNYYFLKLVGATLPRFILQPLLNSSQATLVFSNMPGPQSLSICGGNVLKNLVFFAPHKGTTGLNVTALCYGGVLRFAAMADAALVSRSEDLGLILNGMVDEIHRLHALYVV